MVVWEKYYCGVFFIIAHWCVYLLHINIFIYLLTNVLLIDIKRYHSDIHNNSQSHLSTLA
jgi:hypothetical protein